MGSKSPVDNFKTPLVLKTPLVYSAAFTRKLGKGPVYLKLDNLQPSGSFKIRGISETITDAKGNGYKTIVGCSGGNAGYAMAMSAESLGLAAEIFIPVTSPDFMKEMIEETGARVVKGGTNFSIANARAQERVQELGPTAFYVSPYDQKSTWIGNSKMIDEIKEDLENVYGEFRPPSAVIASIGGGGMALGVLIGLERHEWSDKTFLMAMETEGADAFHKSTKSGKREVLKEITSLATSLGTLSVSSTLLKKFKEKKNIISSVVSDKDAALACLKFANEHRMLVELACGASLAAIYSKQKVDWNQVTDDGPVIVEICGGNLVNLDLMNDWKNYFGFDSIWDVNGKDETY